MDEDTGLEYTLLVEEKTKIEITIPLAEPDELTEQEESRRHKFSDFFGALTILLVFWIDINFVWSTNELLDQGYFRDGVVLCVYHLAVMLWCWFVTKLLIGRQRPFKHDACNFLLFFLEAGLIAMLLRQIYDELVALAIAER